MITDIFSEVATVQTGTIASVVIGALGVAIKMFERRIERHDLMAKERNRIRKRYDKEFEDYIDMIIPLSVSQSYGVFSRKLQDFIDTASSELGAMPKKVRVIRKTVERTFEVETLRDKYFSEVEKIFLWAKKWIVKNTEAHDYHIMKEDELLKKLHKEATILHGHITTKVPTEVCEHPTIFNVVNEFFTFEEIYRVYKNIIDQYIEIELKYDGEIRELEERAIISRRKKKGKK